MKKTFTKILAVCFLMAGTTLVTNAQTKMGPEFSAESTTVDFGQVDNTKDPGFRVLKFKNTGSSPLTITNAVGSCGCTIPEWPKEPIKAGATAEIKIKYDITRIGTISKTVTITTNEEESKDANGQPVYKTHLIQVKGNVTAGGGQ
jgi:hypothetical protein